MDLCKRCHEQVHGYTLDGESSPVVLCYQPLGHKKVLHILNVALGIEVSGPEDGWVTGNSLLGAPLTDGASYPGAG